MSDESSPESRRDWGLDKPPRPDLEPFELPVEAPIPPSFGRASTEIGSQPRQSIEPGRLSMAVLDPDALAPLFFAGLFMASFIGLAYLLSGFLSDFVLAFILVGMTRRPYERLRMWLRGRAVLASLIAALAIAFGIIGPLATLVYIIGLDATVAIQRLPTFLHNRGEQIVEQAIAILGRFGFELSKDNMLDWLTGTLGSVHQVALDWGGRMLADAVAGVVHLVIIVVMVFYILIDGHKLRAFLFDLSPLPDDEDAQLIETFLKVSRGVVLGNGLAGLIQGVLGGAAMTVAGVPSPVLWGGMMVFCSFVPLIGISAVSIPSALYLYFSGHPGTAIAFYVFCSVQGFIVENIIKTKLMGSAMRMHDLMVFLSILGGLSAFGVIGLVYGPLLAMLFMTLSEMYQKRYRPKLVAQLGMRR